MNKILKLAFLLIGLGAITFGIIVSKNNGSITNVQKVLTSKAVESETGKLLAWTGSGFYITKDGYIATAKHVVSSDLMTYIVTNIQGQKCLATVVQRLKDDNALLKVDPECMKNHTVFGLQRPNKLSAGTEVYSLGYPLTPDLDAKQVLVKGIFSALMTSEDLIISNIVIEPGHSGGALYLENGNAIGTNHAVPSMNNSIVTGISLISSINTIVDYALQHHLSIYSSAGKLSDELLTLHAQGATVLIEAYFDKKDYNAVLADILAG